MCTWLKNCIIGCCSHYVCLLWLFCSAPIAIGQIAIAFAPLSTMRLTSTSIASLFFPHLQLFFLLELKVLGLSLEDVMLSILRLVEKLILYSECFVDFKY